MFWMRTGRQDRMGMFTAPVQIAVADRVPLLDMGMPLAGGSGQVLVTQVDLRGLWQRVDEVYAGPTGRALVVSREGVIIAHPDRAYIGEELPPPLRPVLDGYEGATSYVDALAGQRMLATYSPVGKQSGWGIVVEQAYAEAVAPLRTIALTTFGVMLVAAVLSALLTTLMGRSIVRPLLTLETVTGEIAQTGRIDRRVAMSRQDEVGRLADAFDRMLTSLQESQARASFLAGVLENASQPFAVGYPDGRLGVANRAFCELVGYNEADLRSIDWNADLTPVEWRAEETRHLQALHNSGKPVRYEKEYRRQDGSRVPVELLVHLVCDQTGQPEHYYAFVTDLTERKQAQDALRVYSEQLEKMVAERTHALEEAQAQLVRREKLAVLGQLSGSIAHELRSPLGAIKNAAYLMNMLLDDPSFEMQEILDLLNREIKTSEQIINNLLDFARTRAPTKQAVEINQIVKHALAGIVVPESVMVRHELADLPPVAADPGQLEQVFSNLIRNAIQAMPGGGQLVIKTGVLEPEWVTTTITDTGVGIAPEHMARLFEPLFTTKAKGIGLGLALVKMLIEAHGGKIGVESQAGEGTTFAIQLPIA